MIARLSGAVWGVGKDHVVVNVGGIGLKVHVPSSLLGEVDGPGQPIELFTHLHVRENELTLYGFAADEEVALFRLLLGISGIGPRTALALLSGLSLDALRQAVVQEEPGILTRVPGVGQKTAKAIILHLKDKLLPTAAGAAPLFSEADATVIGALTGLGFSLVEAQRALQSLPRDQDMPIEERVRQALAYFAAK